MVSSLLVDALNDPTRALKDIYDPYEEIDIFPRVVSSHFSKIFESANAFNEVRVSPTSLTLPRTNCLRRYQHLT
jgi:hypothetical protein